MQVAGVELGGTKTVMVAGKDGRIEKRIQFPTTTPRETLSKVRNTLLDFNNIAPIDAIGIASFGPVRIDQNANDYGKMLTTPKAGWSGANIIASARISDNIRVVIDTDVNAAAIAEYRIGAAKNCANAIYLTIGTGLGGGILVHGAPVHGVLHPEIGHIRTRRSTGDEFGGVCPFHGDCIEGLISGPALAKRFECDPATIGPDDARWFTVANDLAELLAVLILTHSPQRIVIGGGVALGQVNLLELAKLKLPDLLAGYLNDFNRAQIDEVIVRPHLLEDAGAVGAMLLALE